ncbi:Uncharacterised protein [Mycobacteroides abscessus]|nr:Uncharacterised protein [Mycobacteroides abscessus]SKW29102.1 Uncharacterised protein [Mycobacteroides abscessus subsp. abscessus]
MVSAKVSPSPLRGNVNRPIAVTPTITTIRLGQGMNTSGTSRGS